jgi:hypothetical protein
VPAVMPGAEPFQIRGRLNPRANRIRVANAWVVGLEPLEVDTVLQRELHMRVVQFKLPAAFAEVVAVLPDRALGRLAGLAPIRLKVAKVDVALAGFMGWVVNQIAVGDFLVMRLSHR